jgi:cystathionine beta-lyase/cystathionine gamma-synthase
MFEEILPRFQVSHSYIDGTDIANFKAGLQKNTTVIYLESPSSWTYELQDLQAVADFAKENAVITIVDNSYCTPLYQKPITMGIDLVLQSATKYISGHSDTIAGVLSGSRKMIERIFNSEYNNIGSGIQPFNAWLLIRGLRTLEARLERIDRTTKAILPYLMNHQRIEKVIFPLDPLFPQYALAQKQMQGACGLLTLVIKAETCATIELFCNSLKHIFMAVSWGGHESLIIPKCAGMKPEQFDATNQEHRMLRLYVGLESTEYLIQDLEQAFLAIKHLS